MPYTRRATAFVAGATGYTGREVVRLLVKRGARVVAHVRSDSPRLAEWRQRFAAMGAETDATPWEPAAMRGALARVDPTHLFALLGTTRKRERAEGRDGAAGYEAVDYGLTSLLVKAARAAGTRPRVVYLSAAGVGPGSRNAYVAVRWRMEEELRASGLPFVIARPSFITGADREERRPTERVLAAAADRLLALPAALGGGHFADRWRSLTATQLATALVRLAFDPEAEGRTVDASEMRT